MKFSKQCFISALILAGFVSCSDDAPFKNENGGTGVLRLALKTNADVMVSPAKTRAGSESITAPDVELFKIKLTKSDNSFSQTWNALSEFNAEEGFLSGSYNLEAFYGDLNEEGFDKPYFYGNAQATILEDKTTNVSLTATLANSMVSIVYSDEFKKYFSSYSARVHSTGHEYIDFAAGETRPAYVAPGNIDLFVNITRNGKETSLQPSSFTAQPRHHYTVKFDIQGGVGDTKLTITFEDELIAEDVQIDLTDELFTTPGPSISPAGFVSGQSMEFIEGSGLDNSARFNVVARGGLKEANFTVVSDTYSPAFGSEVNLCGASASLQNQLNESGLKAVGFYKNPEECRLGYVELQDFTKSLPAGTHTVALLVKDKFTRCSEPVTVTLTSVPVEITASSSGLIYGSNEAVVSVAYNGSRPENISFKALDNYGIYQDCNIINMAKIRTRAIESKNYTFTISVPATDRDKLPVQVYYSGQLKSTIELPVTLPSYNIEADAYASKVVLKIKADDPSKTSLIAEHMKVFVVGPAAVAKRMKGARRSAPTVSRDVENGLVTIEGLAPATAYTLNTTLVAGENPTIAASAKVTTEAALEVPNGNFENLTQTINLSNIEQGGEWTITAIGGGHQTHASILVSEPDGWASVNKKTCSDEAKTKNTWFLNPAAYANNISWTVHHPDAKALGIGQSAYNATPAEYQNLLAQNGSSAMIVRNVGYNLNGTKPAIKKQTGNTDHSNYFNPDAPAQGAKAVGKLFLGSYAFSGGSETYNEGVGFASRPSALKGFYKYAPGSDNAESAVVTVTLLNGSEVIGSGSVKLSSKDAFTEFSVPVSYSKTFVKATSLRIMIASSDKNDSNVVVDAHAANKDQASFFGATLTVDNLSFVY